MTFTIRALYAQRAGGPCHYSVRGDTGIARLDAACGRDDAGTVFYRAKRITERLNPDGLVIAHLVELIDGSAIMVYDAAEASVEVEP